MRRTKVLHNKRREKWKNVGNAKIWLPGMGSVISAAKLVNAAEELITMGCRMDASAVSANAAAGRNSSRSMGDAAYANSPTEDWKQSSFSVL